jgi:hypothetical protein
MREDSHRPTMLAIVARRNEYPFAAAGKHLLFFAISIFFAILNDVQESIL